MENGDSMRIIKMNKKIEFGFLILLMGILLLTLPSVFSEEANGGVAPDNGPTSPPSQEKMDAISAAASNYVGGSASEDDLKLLNENQVDLKLLDDVKNRFGSGSSDLSRKVNLLMTVLLVYVGLSLILFVILFRKTHVNP